jgi:hypothetical protein
MDNRWVGSLGITEKETNDTWKNEMKGDEVVIRSGSCANKNNYQTLAPLTKRPTDYKSTGPTLGPLHKTKK